MEKGLAKGGDAGLRSVVTIHRSRVLATVFLNCRFLFNNAFHCERDRSLFDARSYIFPATPCECYGKGEPFQATLYKLAVRPLEPLNRARWADEVALIPSLPSALGSSDSGAACGVT